MGVTLTTEAVVTVGCYHSVMPWLCVSVLVSACGNMKNESMLFRKGLVGHVCPVLLPDKQRGIKLSDFYMAFGACSLELYITAAYYS